MSRPDDFQMDSVGRGICGTETKMGNPDEDGQGEVSQNLKPTYTFADSTNYDNLFYLPSCIFIVMVIVFFTSQWLT